MSNPATNVQGQALHVGDQVTILGLCTSVTGVSNGPGITVQVTTPLGKVISLQAGDCNAQKQPYTAPYYGRTTNSAAAAFGAPDAYDNTVSINGVVVSILNGPWGQNGTVIVKTDYSGTLVTVYSGDIVSHG
jgi:hypothetical protein